MKDLMVSELIQKLQEIQAEHGDIPVSVMNPYELVDGIDTFEPAFFTVMVDEDGKAQEVLIADSHTIQEMPGPDTDILDDEEAMGEA